MLPQLWVVLWLAQEAARVSGQVDRVQVEAQVAAQRGVTLDREKLAERRGTGLGEVFREEVGIEVQRGSAFLGGVFVRGLTGNKVAVYRDGVRYSTSAGRGGVSTFFNLVDAGGIEQAEVLRGPNSTQFGSDSIGGVVQVISRQPADGGGRVEWTPFYSSAAHAFGSGMTWVNRWAVLRGYGQRVNTLRTGQGVDSHAAVTRYLGLPSSVFYDRQPDSAFTQYGGAVHAAWKGWTGHYDRGQQDGAKRTDQLLGGDGSQQAQVANLMTDFAYLRKRAGMVTGTLSYNAQREERVNQANAAALVQRQYERLRVWGAQGQAAKRAWGQELSGGGEMYWEEMKSPAQNTLPRIRNGAEYQMYGVFLEDRVEVWKKRLRLSGGVRWGGGRFATVRSDAWSGRGGAVWRAAEWLSVHGYVSRGFRAPSMTDLGAQGLQGNGVFEALPATLLPEYSDNVDLGFRLRGRGMNWETTVFRAEISNLIVARTLLLPAGAVGQTVAGERIVSQRGDGAVLVAISTQPVQVRANQDRAIFQGLEQKWEWMLPRGLTLSEGLTWLRADDPSNGRVPNVEGAYPPAMGYARLRYNPAGKRYWVEPYWTGNARQARLSELALNDRRIGAMRTRGQIATFFSNWPQFSAGLNLSELQNRLGGTPLYGALPGYGVVGVRGGYTVNERLSVLADWGNIADKNYRGMAWGVDGAGRGVSLQLRWNF